MSRLRRARRPSAPLLIALLALFLAVDGGGAVADAAKRASKLIHGQRIAKNSIPLNRLNESARSSLLKAAAGRSGPQGPAGPAGMQGNVGATGARGPQGEPGPAGNYDGRPADGDLTGVFPDLELDANTVGGDEVADGSLDAADLGAGNGTQSSGGETILPGTCHDKPLTLSGLSGGFDDVLVVTGDAPAGAAASVSAHHDAASPGDSFQITVCNHGTAPLPRPDVDWILLAR